MTFAHVFINEPIKDWPETTSEQINGSRRARANTRFCREITYWQIIPQNF